MLSPETLISISQWLTILPGIALIVFGLFGALMNLMIFSRQRFRKASSSQYILTQSIFDMITLSIALLAQVIVGGFGYPYLFSLQSICTFRNYVTLFSSQAALYSKCLIAFDTWASTSRHARIRQWTKLNRARFLILMNILFWMLASIPYGVFTKILLIRNVWQCTIAGPGILTYQAYFFVPCLILFMPLFSLSFFGYFSYVNMTRPTALAHIRQINRQLVRMVLVQIAVTVISFVPYGLQFIYSTVTANWQKSSQWIALDSLIVQMTRIGFFVNNTVEFYIYISQSNDVRFTFKRIMMNLKVIRGGNRVFSIDARIHNINTT
ncbi:unnamed protein product [Adineta ricciae]|uniref:G-protein coupled receptors family 1 profile domain-containing protein n=1 Tax=Adineta ricciae TaxID=249248 RepID=A0A814SQ42_ADIRI|nr:unnamed protein product [Adineta ricciae]CAF1147707.1 unnamed protein product [Adineta ricciae]